MNATKVKKKWDNLKLKARKEEDPKIAEKARVPIRTKPFWTKFEQILKARKDCNSSHLISSEFPELEDETERNARSLYSLELEDLGATSSQIRARRKKLNKDPLLTIEMKDYLKVWAEVGRLIRDELLEKKAQRALINQVSYLANTRSSTPMQSPRNADRSTPCNSSHVERNFIGVLNTGNQTTVQFSRRSSDAILENSRPGSSFSDTSMPEYPSQFVEANDGNDSEILEFN